MVSGISVTEQLALWEREATDTRPRVASGWLALDSLLRKQSFGPGTLALLAGRLHTRKTAVMVNLIAHMLQAGVPTGLVGLDEAPFMYVSKIASALTGEPHVHLDEAWVSNPTLMDKVKVEYLLAATSLSLTLGHRPSLDELTEWLEMESIRLGSPIRVVFIDYLSLLERAKFSGKDTTRIPQLCEELQVWTNRHDLVTIVLHQVGRQDDSVFRRYHGSTPITPEQLMYGGEQQADIILATYRPALDPEGNLSQEEAISQGIDVTDWMAKRDRVLAYRDDTMLQLIKNRPGVSLDPSGIRLRSVGFSQRMEVVAP